ncbi:CHC2 zinc finger domain-containing protein [Pareuzebyella sediminis]|uniref:CHC2 zinc finger domain-containing protein n=1 Tax=Pareuzebyella sediminis TaxID=2607998 RepID=UPI0011F0304F|nr:CHC2 zinc finger domain-containing protein [Pareuzebyella sediminis]
MNCNQANLISLDRVIKSMGCAALKKHSGGVEQWYENPLRTERTPSFTVNHEKNLWQDLGTGDGGTVIDLVMQYARTNVSGALSWLSEHIGNTSLPKTKTPYSTDKFEEKKPRFEVLNYKPIGNAALIQYIEQRGISLPFAQEHLQEVHYLDTETKKEFFGLGMQN